MPFSLQDSVAIVTAGTSGLGLAVAERLAHDGARVVVNYSLNDERAKKVVEQLKKIYSQHQPNSNSLAQKLECMAIKADVNRREDIELLVQKTITAMGKIDIIISNAGWTKFVDFMDLDQNVEESVWDRCFSANVKSHLFLIYAAREHLQRVNGAFIMTSSVAGVKPSGSSMAYSVTKAAQLHLSKALAIIMAPCVRINCVSPGFMNTVCYWIGLAVSLQSLADHSLWNWIVEMPETKLREAKERTLLKTLTSVGDVADQVILLAKSESVTGANFILDSGFSV